MKPFHDYKNSLEYPKSATYIRYNVYFRGEVLAKNMTVAEINAADIFVVKSDRIAEMTNSIGAVFEVSNDGKAELHEARRAYGDETAKRKMEFRHDLEEEFGIPHDHPKAELLFKLAFRDADSFENAYHEYSDLSELIK